MNPEHQAIAERQLTDIGMSLKDARIFVQFVRASELTDTCVAFNNTLKKQEQPFLTEILEVSARRCTLDFLAKRACAAFPSPNQVEPWMRDYVTRFCSNLLQMGIIGEQCEDLVKEVKNSLISKEKQIEQQSQVALKELQVLQELANPFKPIQNAWKKLWNKDSVKNQTNLAK